MNIFVDENTNDDTRRRRLYEGEIVVIPATDSTRALADFARGMIEGAFQPLDPLTAQYQIPVEEYVAIVAPLKPKFIHDPESKRLIQNIVQSLGCDLEKTYLDVPRLRMVTSSGYLTSGVGYAHHAHRDTWYSAPMCQLNWWMPIYDIDSENTIAFHPRYWSQPVLNGSSKFNYYKWNAEGRTNAAKHIRSDTREQPKAEEPMDLEPGIRIVCQRGSIILFSGAQMHSTVPNTSGVTRYSIDFRTVNLDDVKAKVGAPNLDSQPQGTSLRDFVKGSDLTRMPEEVVRLYEEKGPAEGVLVFDASKGGLQ